MEVLKNTDELSENEKAVLYLISGDKTFTTISETLSITQKDAEILVNGLLEKWNTRNYARLVVEGILRAYTDVGFEMEHARLLNFMQRASLTNDLKNVLLNYYDRHKTIDNSILIKNIHRDQFLQIEGGSLALWNEFRAELMYLSARIRQATRDYGVDLTRPV